MNTVVLKIFPEVLLAVTVFLRNYNPMIGPVDYEVISGLLYQQHVVKNGSITCLEECIK